MQLTKGAQGADGSWPVMRLTARQREIVAQALQLVQEGGLSRMTVKKLAARMGFTEGALYRHFRGKRELTLALMERLEEMLLSPIRKIAEDENLSIRDRIARILRHHVKIVLQHNSLPLLLLSEASMTGDPLLLERMQKILNPYLSTLEDLVGKGQERGEIADDYEPDCLTLLLFGVPAALAIRHRLLPDDEAEKRCERILPSLPAAIFQKRETS